MTNLPRVLLHVGFGHTGTTSLQENIFSRRSDVQYCGLPLGELGGIFSFIKYQSDSEFDAQQVRDLAQAHIFERTDGRTIVVSDETLTEQPEVYYTPRMMPHDIIARRLFALFPTAQVLFTIRSQRGYAVSLFLNLKRNYARMDRQPMPSFAHWFRGNHTQVSNLFLRNLDFMRAIGTYAAAFGRDNIHVVPLETIRAASAEAYLTAVGECVGLTPTRDDLTAFAAIRNRRMTVAENRLWEARTSSLGRLFDEGRRAAQLLRFLVRDSSPYEVEVPDDLVESIRATCGEGNRAIESTFGLPLGALGYPMP